MDGEVNLQGDIWTVVIVAMQAMLTPRPGVPDGTPARLTAGAMKSSTRRGRFYG